MSNQNEKKANELVVTFRSRKAGKEQEHNFHDLPESSQAAIIRYGAQRFINDKLGGSDLSAEEAAEKFDQIYLQLREGWVDRRGSGGGQSVDPIEREAINLAKERIKAALKAKGIPQKDVGKEKMAQLVSSMMEKSGDELREKAKTIVEMQASSVADVDLGDLGI